MDMNRINSARAVTEQAKLEEEANQKESNRIRLQEESYKQQKTQTELIKKQIIENKKSSKRANIISIISLIIGAISIVLAIISLLK